MGTYQQLKKMSKTKQITEFWEDQATEFRQSHLATAPDTYYRKLEISRIEDYLKDNVRVLDIGCGNGYSTIEFAKKFTSSTFIGIDYSEKMITYANKHKSRLKPDIKKRLQFAVGDVLKLANHATHKGKKYDFIVSERCLINLQNWKEQQHALLEMKKLLKKNGRIILCENTQEGLGRLNKLRKRFGLFAINVRWHNYYMPEKKLLAFVRNRFKIEEVNNIGSLYYILSRVVYAKLAALEGKTPDYLHPINKIASDLPSIGIFSPNFVFLLKNK